jgi:hypothetical protein
LISESESATDDAEKWYKKSLEIKEQIDDRPGMSATYHQLGMLEQDQERLDDAEDWYMSSLKFEEQLGNRPGMVVSYYQLGLLAGARGHDVQALGWIVRCIALFDEFPHPETGPAPGLLARLASKLGLAQLERSWVGVTGQPLPPAVREFVERSEDP